MSNQQLWLNEPLRAFVHDMGDGGTPSRANNENFGGHIPWVVVSDVQRKIYNTKENLTAKGLAACTSKLWPENTIILTTGATIGKVGLAKVPLATKQGITGLLANEKVLPEYLYYELLFKKPNIVAWAQGSTFAEIRVPILGKIPLNVPNSHKVQEKISTILECTDQSIEKTEALIEKYQQIKAGLMHDLFTRGLTAEGKLRSPREQAPELYQETPIGWIPKDWQYALLDNLVDRKSGHTPNKDHPEYWNGGIKWVSLSDSRRLDKLYIDKTDHDISQLGILNSSATILPAGTVVMSRDAGVGKSAIMLEPMAVSQHFMAWICGAKMDNHYLYYWLQSNKRNFENIAMGSTIVTIGLPYFKRLKMACPKNVKEQEAISIRLRNIDSYLFSLGANSKKLQQQKSGLMHDLLTGKVPVKIEVTEINHV